MVYEKTSVKPTDSKKQTMHELNRIGTFSILWFLIKRHKTGLLITSTLTGWALVMVPRLPVIVFSLFTK